MAEGGETSDACIAVVTPYYATTPEWLRQCHASVQAQTHPATHVLVADGRPMAEVDRWTAQHIRLPVRHADYGNTPRAIGSLSAIGQGYDAIAYLDADHWYAPDHLASLVALRRETGAAICFSHRYLHRLDGTPLGRCKDADGENFAAVSSMILFRPAFHLASLWALIPPKLHAISDRIMMLQVRKQNVSRAFSDRHTLSFRTSNRADYLAFGEAPPAEATRTGLEFVQALRFLRERGGAGLVVG